VAIPEIVVMDVVAQPSGMREACEAIGVDVVVERLVLGDYLVGRGSIVERKTGLDLHPSVRQRRLWPQIWSISASDRRGYLLIEGSDLAGGPLDVSRIRGMVLTAVGRGVGVLFADNVAESAAWLLATARRDATRA
jgi:ERCC4-type nuclease